MTRDPETSQVEQTRRAVGRLGYQAAVLGLAAGVLAYLVRQPAIAHTILVATLGVLVVLPIINVFAILAEEIRRRDWSFAAAAVVVLALLAFNIARRLFQS